jgi:hypothetical protein
MKGISSIFHSVSLIIRFIHRNINEGVKNASKKLYEEGTEIWIDILAANSLPLRNVITSKKASIHLTSAEPTSVD